MLIRSLGKTESLIFRLDTTDCLFNELRLIPLCWTTTLLRLESLVLPSGLFDYAVLSFENNVCTNVGLHFIAGQARALRNCSAVNQTFESLSIVCMNSSHKSPNQRYILEVVYWISKSIPGSPWSWKARRSCGARKLLNFSVDHLKM